MKAYEERSVRYRQIAGGVDTAAAGFVKYGLGGIYVLLVGLLVLGLTLGAALGAWVALSRFF